MKCRCEDSKTCKAILAMTMWSSPSGGGARETSMVMEGSRGNRGKARLSSERGISRRDRVKPYVLQIRRPLTVILHSLVSYFIPIKRLRVIRFARQFSKLFPHFRKKTRSTLWSFLVNIWLFLFIFVAILDSQSRNSLARSFALTANLRDHTKS